MFNLMFGSLIQPSWRIRWLEGVFRLEVELGASPALPGGAGRLPERKPHYHRGLCSAHDNVRWAAAPGNVVIKPGQSGLPKESVANVSQIVALDRSQLLEKQAKSRQPKSGQTGP